MTVRLRDGTVPKPNTSDAVPRGEGRSKWLAARPFPGRTALARALTKEASVDIARPDLLEKKKKRRLIWAGVGASAVVLLTLALWAQHGLRGAA